MGPQLIAVHSMGDDSRLVIKRGAADQGLLSMHHPGKQRSGER